MNRRSYRSHELTPEERSRGGHARALKLRERRAIVEEIKLERLADAPTPRRRRRARHRSTYGFSSPYERTERVSEPTTVEQLHVCVFGVDCPCPICRGSTGPRPWHRCACEANARAQVG
jgi:hypothetical protein